MLDDRNKDPRPPVKTFGSSLLFQADASPYHDAFVATNVSGCVDAFQRCPLEFVHHRPGELRRKGRYDRIAVAPQEPHAAALAAAPAVAVAVALSFGLGGREAAGKLMDYWLSKWRKD